MAQPEAGATEYVYAAGTRVVRSSEDVAVAVHMLLSALATAERVVETTKDNKYPRVHEAREDTTAPDRGTTDWTCPWPRESGASRNASERTARMTERTRKGNLESTDQQ